MDEVDALAGGGHGGCEWRMRWERRAKSVTWLVLSGVVAQSSWKSQLLTSEPCSSFLPRDLHLTSIDEH